MAGRLAADHAETAGADVSVLGPAEEEGHYAGSGFEPRISQRARLNAMAWYQAFRGSTRAGDSIWPRVTPNWLINRSSRHSAAPVTSPRRSWA